MKNDLTKWHDGLGVDFLKKIGVNKGYTVLDFGCGRGHYTLPASKLVGNKGVVYALDKNEVTLSELEKTITEESIKNVEFIKNISLKDNSVDVVLCYDVLHYMKTVERKGIYNNIRRILRENAIFSVYPKHSKGNLPSGKLADVSVVEVTAEIENSGFVLCQKINSKLLHDGYFEKGLILNFRKGD
jgi:ubiquinone/menaquinone biosynthesis C-methylase UbiE